MHAGMKMCTLGGKEGEAGSELTPVHKKGCEVWSDGLT